MASLMIKCVANTQWKAFASNSEVEYVFRGATLQDQSAGVKFLSDCMQQGSENVVANVQYIFSNVPEGDEQAVVEQLYNTTQELYYGGDLVFGVEGEETLLGEIVDAGVELAAALA